MPLSTYNLPKQQPAITSANSVEVQAQKERADRLKQHNTEKDLLSRSLSCITELLSYIPIIETGLDAADDLRAEIHEYLNKK